MTKTFGTKKAGSSEPETKSTVRANGAEGGNSALKILFGVLSAVAVGLFAYNSFFKAAPESSSAAPATSPPPVQEVESSARLRGGNSVTSPRFPELDHYLTADHVNPDRAKINRYGRTSTLLAGCGTRFDAVRRDYQRENHAAYLALRGSKAAVQEEDLVLPVPPDQGFSRSITAQECSYVSQVVRLGQQNI